MENKIIFTEENKAKLIIRSMIRASCRGAVLMLTDEDRAVIRPHLEKKGKTVESFLDSLKRLPKTLRLIKEVSG